MKVLKLSTYDHRGGAARAAFRLGEGLQTIVDLDFHVMRRESRAGWVSSPGADLMSDLVSRGRQPLSMLHRLVYPESSGPYWASNWLPNRALTAHLSQSAPDLVHLHWVDNFVPNGWLSRVTQPVVWTMHDMWPFTGGCHYAEPCRHFERVCQQCPHLGAGRLPVDFARITWRAKKRAYERKKNLVFVAPSRWLQQEARQSALSEGHDVRVIPNGIDTNVFRPINKRVAREVLGLAPDKRYALFGAINPAGNPHKGYRYFVDAIGRFASSTESQSGCELLAIGIGDDPALDEIRSVIPVTPFGQVTDDITLALIYSAADVFVIPSVQENLPNTIMESLACGTPVVGFDIGGNRDMINHKSNGYLAAARDSADLAAGINWVVSQDNAGLAQLAETARHSCETRFSLPVIVERYVSLYRELVQ